MSQTSPPPQEAARPARRGNTRAAVRYHCAPAMMGRVVADAVDRESQFGWMQNVSLNGIALLVARQVVAGTPVTIQLRGNVSQTSYELVAHVIHCTSEPGGEWILGCQFTRPLTAEMLDDLL